jgi:hypothetical protein
LPRTGHHRSQRHTAGGCRCGDSHEVAALHGPSGQPRRRPGIDAEPAPTHGRGLRRIRREDLEIGIGVERNQRVPRAAPWMLAAGRRANAQPPFEIGHAGVEIRHRIHEMVDATEHGSRLLPEDRHPHERQDHQDGDGLDGRDLGSKPHGITSARE